MQSTTPQVRQQSDGELKTLFGVSFLTRSISVIIQTVTPIVLVSALREPTEFAGWAIAGFWIANALGALLAAGLIRSRPRSILIGFALLSVSFVGLALSAAYPLAFVGFVILSGVGLSSVQAFLVPSMYASGSSNKLKPHIGIANYSMALSLGMVAGPICASVAIWYFGYSTLFGLLAGITAAMLVVCIAIGFQGLFEREDTLGAIRPAAILKTMRSKGFANYYALNLLYSMMLPIFLSYGGIYGEERYGLSATFVLGLFALVFCISTAMRTVFTRSKVAQFKSLLIASFILLVVSFFAIGASPSVYLFIFGFLLFSIPHALIYPATTFLALDSGGSDSLISSTYLFATSSGVAEFFSPIIAVVIIGMYGFSSVFFLMSPIAIAGVVLSIALPKILSQRIEILREAE